MLLVLVSVGSLGETFSFVRVENEEKPYGNLKEAVKARQRTYQSLAPLPVF